MAASSCSIDRLDSGATHVGTKTVTLPGQKKFHDASEVMDMNVQCCVYRCVWLRQHRQETKNLSLNKQFKE